MYTLELPYYAALGSPIKYPVMTKLMYNYHVANDLYVSVGKYINFL